MEDFSLRPLLFAVGAAAAALSVYCYVQRGGGKRNTAENKPEPEDPVCEQATERAVVHPTEVVQEQMTKDETEAEEKIQKHVVSVTLLEARVRELEELLCETRTDCDMKIQDSVAEAEEKHQKCVETITQLEEEKCELRKQLETLRDTVKECEGEREAHSILQMENNELKKSLIHEKLLLKVSVAEAEEKHQKCVETITQLEEEKSELRKQLETLGDTVKECEGEREAHSILQTENNELKKSLIHEKLLLKVSVAEAEEKNQKCVETITQLKEEKCELRKQLETLGDTVKECEGKREAHSILQMEKDEIMKTLIHEKELLKDSVAEAEEKHQKCVETITQLEEEKCELRKQLETLRDTVKECEGEREAHSILQMEKDETLKTLIHEKELLKVSMIEAEEKHQRSVETITQLEEEKCELSKQVEPLRNNVEDIRHLLYKHNTESANLTKACVEEWEELLKVSVAEAEAKHQKALETITQLEEEKCEIRKQLETLRDTVKECGEEREAHSILQTEKDETMKTLIHEKELLKVSVAEAEEKHQKCVETITQLEEEKCEIRKQLETLRDTVKECEGEREAHSILQTETDKMLKTLVHEKELLKDSVAEAKEKHQKCVETITQLEEEKCELRKQLETLRDTVKECEGEREAHSILKTETDETTKTLIHEKELLKVSVAEAEEKHQKCVETITQLEDEKCELRKQVERLKDIGHLLIDRNVKFANLTKMFEREQEELMKVSLAKGEEKHQKDVETIAQLKEEKSDLTKQVERLRDTVQGMGNDLFESHRDCDEHISDEERERRSVLQLEYDELKMTLTHKEELLKVSVAEAEGKHQKALETITRLEEEKCELSEEVETLRKTLQDMADNLFETHRECDRLTDEIEREREAHRILQSRGAGHEQNPQESVRR